MRYEFVKNDKMAELMNKKGEIIEQGRELSKQIEELIEKQNKLGYEAEKIVGKVSKMFTKEKFYKELGEFEIPRQFYPQKDGQIKIEIIDVVEEYANNYREKKKEAEKSKENDLSKLKK